MRALSKGMMWAGLTVICLLLCFGGAIAQSDKPAKETAVKETPKETAKPAAKESGKQPKDFVVEQLSKIEYDNPDFKVQVVTPDRRRTYRIGDRIEFRFRTNRDAYVTIIDVGSSGKVHVLFPNRWHRDNRVEADRWYRIPPRRADYSFRVRGPEGVNYVKAIATRDRYDFVPREAELTEDSPFYEVKNPELVVKDIGAELGRRDRKNWAEYQSRIRIVDRDASWRDDDRDWDRDRDRYRDRDRDRDRDWDRDASRWDRSDWDDDWGRERYRDRPIVKLWTDHKSYRVGEPVSFYFYSEKDCYLNLVSFGTSGRVRVIFPNRFQKDNFIRGGKVVEIPATRDDEFLFKVDGPPGVETVKAVATRHKYHLYRGKYNWDRYAYQVWEQNPEEIEEDIRVRLGELPDDYYVRARAKFRVER